MVKKYNVHREVAMTETYNDVEKLIAQVAWKTVRRHGGRFEDYVSAGSEAFMIAYETYDASSNACFSTWLWWRLRAAMTEEIHKRSVGRGDDLNELASDWRFDCRRFIGQLGKDARTVLTMVWDSPFEMMDIVHHEDFGPAMREGLCRRLRRLGWSAAQIFNAFTEIQEALG